MCVRSTYALSCEEVVLSAQYTTMLEVKVVEIQNTFASKQSWHKDYTHLRAASVNSCNFGVFDSVLPVVQELHAQATFRLHSHGNRTFLLFIPEGRGPDRRIPRMISRFGCARASTRNGSRCHICMCFDSSSKVDHRRGYCMLRKVAV